MTTNETMRKWISILLCLCMLVQNAPVFAFAAETDNLCDHHTQHSADVCGYVPAVAGADCTHVCGEGCSYVAAVEEVLCACEATDESGALVHTEGCGYVEGVEGVACDHVHGDCGFVQAVEGQPCTYHCDACLGHDHEEDALPEPSLDQTPACTCGAVEEGANDHAPFCALYVAPENPRCLCAEACTAEVFNEYCDVCGVDYTKCGGTDTAAQYTEGDAVAKVGDTEYVSFDDALANWTDGTTLTLLSDVTDVWEIKISGKSVTFDLNGHTFSGEYGLFNVIEDGSLVITDNSTEGTGLLRMTEQGDDAIFSRGNLTFAGGTATSASEYNSTVFISAGTFLMTGGTVENTAGASVELCGGTTGTISGGTIISGGNFGIWPQGALTISGSPVIHCENGDSVLFAYGYVDLSGANAASADGWTILNDTDEAVTVGTELRLPNYTELRVDGNPVTVLEPRRAGVISHTHTGGTQTCQGYFCTACESYYGEADPNAHSFNSATGNCAACHTSMASATVTQADGETVTYYQTLGEALDTIRSVDYENSTVTLLRSVTENGLGILGSRSICTLDLGGNTLTGGNGNIGLAVHTDAVVTIRNGTITTANNASLRVNTAAQVTLQNVTVAGYAAIEGGGKLTVDDDSTVASHINVYNGTLVLSGMPEIGGFFASADAVDHTKDGTQIFVKTDGMVQVTGDMGTGAYKVHTSGVTVTEDAPLEFACGADGITMNPKWFESVDSSCHVAKNAAGALELRKGICAHTGGEATCTEKAVCDLCNTEYGETDSDKHSVDPITEKCTQCQTQFAAKVTMTGGKTVYYTDFSDAQPAWLASGDQTLTLLDNVCAEDSILVAVTGLVLDLNGRTLTGNIDVGDSTDEGGLSVQDSGSGGKISGILTIETGSAQMTGGWIDSPDAFGSVYIRPNGTFTVSGGKVTGKWAIRNGGTVSISGNVILEGMANDEWNNGYGLHNDGTATISGTPTIQGEHGDIYIEENKPITFQSVPATPLRIWRYSPGPVAHADGVTLTKDHFISAKAGLKVVEMENGIGLATCDHQNAQINCQYQNQDYHANVYSCCNDTNSTAHTITDGVCTACGGRYIYFHSDWYVDSVTLQHGEKGSESMMRQDDSLWRVMAPAEPGEVSFSDGYTETARMEIPEGMNCFRVTGYDDETWQYAGVWYNYPCTDHTFESDGYCKDCGAACAHASVYEDGKCAVCGLQHTTRVTVGESVSYFANLAKAVSYISKLSGSETAYITILCDTAENFRITMPAKTIVLDLNGKTLKLNGLSYNSGADVTLQGGNGGVLIINTHYVSGGAKLTLQSGTIQASSDPAVHVYGTFVMNGGCIISQVEAINVQTKDNTAVQITGGTVSSATTYALKNISKSAKISLSGGTFVGGILSDGQEMGFKLSDLVAQGYRLVDENGNEVNLNMKTTDATVTVVCDHSLNSNTTSTCKGILCENCGTWYGEADASKHTGTLGDPVPTDDGTRHAAAYDCCGLQEFGDHSTGLDENKATCQRGNICDLCNAEYGEKDTSKHVRDEEKGHTCMGYYCAVCENWYGAGNGDNHLKIGPCDCGLTAYPIWVSGIQVTSDNKDNVLPFISGGAGMPGIRYVPDTNVLYLAGKFGDPDADNIAVKAIGDLTVEVTNTCAVYGNVDVTGKLNITGEKTMTVYGYSYGIQAASVAFGNDVHVIIKGAQAVKANDVTGSGYCRITADEGFIPFVAPGGENYYEVAGKKMLVAMVTVGESTTYFHTLDDAVTAAEKGTETAPATVTLLCDVDLGDSCQEITSGVFTLDLNGFELASTNSSAGVLYLQGGNITITDGSAEQDGTITGSKKGVSVTNSSTLTITGGTITSTKEYGYGVDAFVGTLTITGGTILAAGDYGTGVYASGSTLTITGGKITGTGTDGWGVAIRYGSLTITGGEISGTEHGVDVDRSTVTITGGEISGTEHGVFAAYSSEVTIAGGTISGKDVGVYVYSDSTVTIAGGTISSDMYGVLAFYDGTVKITGGEISGDGESSCGVFANESTVSITGGTISGAVNDLCTIENSSITLGLGEDGVGATFPGGITVEDATLNGILAEGAAYWQGDKMLTDIADDATEITDGDVTVKAECKHENATYPEITDTQHKLVCSCGFEESKDHRFAPDTHECICSIIETFAVTVENEGGTADKVTLSNTTAVYGQDYVTHISASVGSNVEVWGIKYSGEDGWIGNGWFTYDENTETLTVYGQYVTGDLVINAVPIIYITTDLAGGTLTENWQYTYEVLDGRISEYREYSEEAVALYGEYVYDEETGEMSFIPDPNKVFRKDGYRVSGYEDAAGNLYSADHTFPLTGDISVTLVWECIHQGEVEFRDNGTGSHDGYCINCGEPLGHYAQRPHDFHNDAHQCVCGLVETFKIHTNIDGDAAFEWTTAMDFGSSIKTQLEDGLLAFPDMTPTRSGYTFAGEWIFWLDEACSKKYDGATVPAQDIWVQPVFVPILYRITWDMGTCDYKLISPDVLPEELEYCADAQIPFHTISFEYIKAPAGYEFLGFVDGEGNQLQLISSDLHKLHLTVSGDMTVKAVVEPKSYAATWESGDGDSYEKEFKYGETITIPDNEAFADTFRKAGYTHTGWEGYAEGMTMPIGGVTFTAKWQINEAVLPVTSGKYTGKAHTPAVIVDGLTEERDFTVTYPADMTNVGEKIITVTGKLGGTTTVTYTIEKADAPVITFPQVRNHIIYGQLLQDAKLEFYRNDEGTFDWAAPDGKPESSGDYALDFYPADLDNYDWQACTWQSHGAVWVEARNALCAMGAVIVDPAVGTGTVSIEGWTYGDAANAPVPVSQTNGTDAVTYRYKAMGADDSTYSEQVPVNAGAYTVQATFAATEHYTEAAATAVFTISKTPLTVTAKDSTITYGDAPENAGVTYTGFVNGETESVLSGSLAYSYNYEQFGDVGSYTITPSGLTSGNYEITFTPGTLTVEPKYIEVVAEEVEKTYGDPDPEFLYWVDGLEDGDTLSGALSREQGEDAGSYAITQGTLDGGKNYRISRFYDANLTIRPKRISAGDFTVTPSSMPYTGQPQTVKITVPAGAEYDVLEGSLTATDVGMYEFTIQFKGNYSGIFTQGFEILRVAPEFTAPVANELTYSGGDQALVTAGNTADGKLVYSLAENGEYTETIPTGKNAGNYTVWYYVQGDENHTDSAKASVTVAIVKAKLTVAAKDNTITYGDAPENAGVTYTGFANGEPESVLSGSLAYSYNYEQFGDVGSYTVTPGGLTSGNYEITFTPGTLRVEKKTITVKADAASKIYGEADLELTYQVEGLVNGDELTGELMRAAGENVGVYAITQGTLTAGDNYSITFTGADFAITKAQQTIKLDATAAELACTKTLERIAQAIGTVSYTSSDASVATVDASGKVTALKPGTVTITVNAAETGNYFPAQAAYTVTVRHNYSAVVTKPTCEDKGFTTYTCACGDYYVADEVTELGHTPKAAEEENRVEATCTDAGSYELAVYCAVCGEELERTGYTIPVKGHSLGTWQVTKPAGCTTKGVERRECSDCDHYETRTIPFTGHGYDNEWDTSCSNCGQHRKIATVSMFRMYNPYSGEHFYTGSEAERDSLVAAGWNYEGVAFDAPLYMGKPVYRYYHHGIGDHHYTMSSEEGAALVAAGWNYEGIAWNSASEGHVPYYRLLNPYATVGAHHFTSSVEERDYLISVGWIAEGIGWYVMRY